MYTETRFSMQRELALAVLLTFAAGPIGQVVCGWMCAHVSEATSSEKCHEETGPEPALSVGADHCEGSALPVALTAKRGDAPSAPSPGRAAVQSVPATHLNACTSSPPGDSAADPPVNRLVPLRI